MDVQGKGGNTDYFTNADTLIQKTVVSNLRELYPYMKIVGEEDENNESF